MGSDINDKLCTENIPAFSKGTNHYIAIILSANEQDEAKRLYEALSVNGQIEMPLENLLGCAL